MDWLKKLTNTGKPNFSTITTMEQVQGLLRQGQLVRVLMVPAELGGQEADVNALYVPDRITEIKDQFTGTLVRFTTEGLINKLAVEPEYRGKSLIPCKINFRAWHSEKSGGFNHSIEIW